MSHLPFSVLLLHPIKTFKQKIFVMWRIRYSTFGTTLSSGNEKRSSPNQIFDVSYLGERKRHLTTSLQNVVKESLLYTDDEKIQVGKLYTIRLPMTIPYSFHSTIIHLLVESRKQGRECEAACECSHFCEPWIKALCTERGHWKRWKNDSWRNNWKPPNLIIICLWYYMIICSTFFDKAHWNMMVLSPWSFFDQHKKIL